MQLFNTFCTSFYGSPLWILNDLEAINVCYRKCIRRILKLPYRTHCNYIAPIMNRPDLNTQLLMRFTSFWSKAFLSDSAVLKLCCNLSLRSTSRVGLNVKRSMYILNVSSNVLVQMCTSPSIISRRVHHIYMNSRVDSPIVEVIKESLMVRDGLLYVDDFDHSEINEIINSLCIL